MGIKCKTVARYLLNTRPHPMIALITSMITLYVASHLRAPKLPINAKQCIYAVINIKIGSHAYVGQTKMNAWTRFIGHQSEAKSEKQPSPFHQAWIKNEKIRDHWVVIPLEIIPGDFSDGKDGEKRFFNAACPLEDKWMLRMGEHFKLWNIKLPSKEARSAFQEENRENRPSQTTPSPNKHKIRENRPSQTTPSPNKKARIIHTNEGDIRKGLDLENAKYSEQAHIIKMCLIVHYIWAGPPQCLRRWHLHASSLVEPCCIPVA